jgi:hypothetical protein
MMVPLELVPCVRMQLTTKVVHSLGSPKGPARPLLAVRCRFADLRRTLLDCGREIGIGARVNAAVHRLCIEAPPIAAVEPAGIETCATGSMPSRDGCGEQRGGGGE